MIVSRDLDLTMALYLQFSLKFGCDDADDDDSGPDGHSVIVQFSSNGGVVWQFLQELHFANTTEPKCVRTSHVLYQSVSV